jgi:seryl-tRNA synthetase
MLALQYIRENKEDVLEGLKKRGFKNLKIINQIINLDSQRRTKQAELDKHLAESNQMAKEIGNLFKAGEIKKANVLKEKSLVYKIKTKKLQDQLQKTTSLLFDLRTQVPNIPHQRVPYGNSEEDNEEVFNSGAIPKLEDGAQPHWELANKYDLIDFDLGNKITGAGFPVYKGKGAKLQRGLINFFLDRNIAAGYKEVQLPLLVNEESGFGTGQLPDKEGQMYHVQNENLYLIPTAEVPITNIYRNNLLDVSELPIALTGYTPCFRREAGSYGAHVRGLNRLHQFDKVEIVRIEKPENALQALEKMIDHIKSILNELEMPYRILKLCGGDLGFTSALTYDFEIYSTAQKRWLEISSVSTFNNFQAERLKLRFKDAQGKKQSVHTLNGSSLALPRVIAGLLENCQSPQGIKIPKSLVAYTGFDQIK